MTVYGDAISAVRTRLLAIGVTTLLTGISVFLLGYLTTPRIQVIGYVEVARLHHVDAYGNLREELAVPAVVLAGQINSGAFFETPRAVPTGNPTQLRRTRIIARVPTRTENVELTARADSADEGIQVVTALVQRIGVTHQTLQQPTLERLQKRYVTMQAELDELLQARKQLERTIADLAKAGSAREGVENFVMVFLRSQMNKDIHELERVRQTTSDAIAMTTERQTRLIGNVISYRASVLAPLALGIVGGLFGALLAAAVVVALAYRRGVGAHD